MHDVNNTRLYPLKFILKYEFHKKLVHSKGLKYKKACSSIKILVAFEKLRK